MTTTMTAYGNTTFNLALFDLHDLVDGASYVRSSTSLRINYAAGEWSVFTGAGFSYDSQGYPVSGTVTGFSSYENYALTLKISSSPGVAATSLTAAAKTVSTADDLTLLRSLLTGNDVLTGANAADTINGYGGNDEITGGKARDVLTGGTGLDDFNYRSLYDSTVGAGRDRITDFQTGYDDIDLSLIDANGSAAGNGVFSFLAAKGAAFTGVKGQVRWYQIDAPVNASDKTIVEGDINADKVADFQIELTGLKTLSSLDFIL